MLVYRRCFLSGMLLLLQCTLGFGGYFNDFYVHIDGSYTTKLEELLTNCCRQPCNRTLEIGTELYIRMTFIDQNLRSEYAANPENFSDYCTVIVSTNFTDSYSVGASSYFEKDGHVEFWVNDELMPVSNVSHDNTFDFEEKLVNDARSVELRVNTSDVINRINKFQFVVRPHQPGISWLDYWELIAAAIAAILVVIVLTSVVTITIQRRFFKRKTNRQVSFELQNAQNEDSPAIPPRRTGPAPLYAELEVASVPPLLPKKSAHPYYEIPEITDSSTDAMLPTPTIDGADSTRKMLFSPPGYGILRQDNDAASSPRPMRGQEIDADQSPRTVMLLPGQIIAMEEEAKRQQRILRQEEFPYQNIILNEKNNYGESPVLRRSNDAMQAPMFPAPELPQKASRLVHAPSLRLNTHPARHKIALPDLITEAQRLRTRQISESSVQSSVSNRNSNTGVMWQHVVHTALKRSSSRAGSATSRFSRSYDDTTSLRSVSGHSSVSGSRVRKRARTPLVKATTKRESLIYMADDEGSRHNSFSQHNVASSATTGNNELDNSFRGNTSSMESPTTYIPASQVKRDVPNNSASVVNNEESAILPPRLPPKKKTVLKAVTAPMGFAPGFAPEESVYANKNAFHRAR